MQPRRRRSMSANQSNEVEHPNSNRHQRGSPPESSSSSARSSPTKQNRASPPHQQRIMSLEAALDQGKAKISSKPRRNSNLKQKKGRGHKRTLSHDGTPEEQVSAESLLTGGGGLRSIVVVPPSRGRANSDLSGTAPFSLCGDSLSSTVSTISSSSSSSTSTSAFSSAASSVPEHLLSRLDFATRVSAPSASPFTSTAAQGSTTSLRQDQQRATNAQHHRGRFSHKKNRRQQRLRAMQKPQKGHRFKHRVDAFQTPQPQQASEDMETVSLLGNNWLSQQLQRPPTPPNPITPVYSPPQPFWEATYLLSPQYRGFGGRISATSSPRFVFDFSADSSEGEVFNAFGTNDQIAAKT
ncbi:hypothetical protein QOT17_011155 [Balamuthia mandrillaris]